MKIGILTFFESDNYGTVFQAFALQRYLQRHGHTVELVHLHRNVLAPSSHFENHSSVDYSFADKFRIKLSTFFHRKSGEIKKTAFAVFRNRNLSVGNNFYDSDEALIREFPQYDLYLSGGDQIWNPYHKVFSFHYMWDFLPHGCRIASYASSFGVKQIDDVKLLDEMKKYLSRFAVITVREKSGVNIVKNMGLLCRQVVDPVFLLDDYWKTQVTINGDKKYCLVYALVDYPKEEDSIIRELAKKHGWGIKILPENRRNHSTPYQKEFEASPLKFLELIANAQFVFTNSFHGVAFSVLFQRQFALLSATTSESASKRARLTDFLEDLDLTDRPMRELLEEIDYDTVKKRLSQMIVESKEILNKLVKTEC